MFLDESRSCFGARCLNSLLDTKFWHTEVWCDADGKHEYTLKPNWTAQQANGPTVMSGQGEHFERAFLLRKISQRRFLVA